MDSPHASLKSRYEAWSSREKYKKIKTHMKSVLKIFKGRKKNVMALFYGWGSTTLRLEPLRGVGLLSTTKFLEIHGTHFTDLGRMKGWVDLGAIQWFWTREPWIGNPAL